MKTLIKTFTDDIYIIEDKTPAQILASIKDQDFVEMPNGSVINRKTISAIQTYEDYQFQTGQRTRHKKGQFLQGGNWNDSNGYIANAHLEEITGTTIKKLTGGNTKKNEYPS